MQSDEQIAGSSPVEAPIRPTDEQVAAYLKGDGQSERQEAAEPAEPDTATKSEATKEAANEPEPDAGHKGKGIDKRIKELRELLAATKEIRQARRQETEPAKPAAKAADAMKAPRLEDFEDVGAWQDANLKYFEQIAEAKADAKLKAWQERQAAEVAQKAWAERVTKAGYDPGELTQAVNTYAQLVEAGEMPAFTAAMVETLNDPTTDAGPAVTMHLIENPSEVQRIAGLSPVAQVRELDRLAAALGDKAKAAQEPAKPAPVAVGKVVPKVSAAKAPVTELGGGEPSDPVEAAIKAGDFAAYERAMRRRSA